MSALAKLLVRLGRPGQVFVPPHSRLRNGRREDVDGYWRDIADVQKMLARSTDSRERAALLRAVGRRTGDSITDEDPDSPSTEFGMRYSANNETRREVRAAQAFRGWDDMPVVDVDLSQPINATEENVTARTINRVAQSGKVKEGYYANFVRASDGQLYVVDGHHRVAIAHAQGEKTLKGRVLDLSVSGIAAKKLRRSGGFSIRKNGKQPKTGYMVAMPGAEEVHRGELFRGPQGVELAKDFQDRYREMLDSPETYFGGWFDPNTRLVYLDVSRNVQDLEEAKRLGKKWGQIAVFDVEKGDSVYLANREEGRVVFLSKTDPEAAAAEIRKLIEESEEDD